MAVLPLPWKLMICAILRLITSYVAAVPYPVGSLMRSSLNQVFNLARWLRVATGTHQKEPQVGSLVTERDCESTKKSSLGSGWMKLALVKFPAVLQCDGNIK